jgi:hypothetical protein
MNRYVKVKGHSNWFLVLTGDDFEPENFSENMQEKILRSEVASLHDPNDRMDFTHRLILSAARQINYEELAKKYGTILIRPIGSFMMLRGNEIIEEKFDHDFPIDEFGEVVICENDSKAEYKWVEFLKEKFPNKKIVTINYFDLRSENEVKQYFDNAEYITFSTTFSNLEWYKKLTKLSNTNHKIIGYCHNPEKWAEALTINNKVEIIEKL